MKVRDIMTQPVITAHPSDSIAGVIRIMLDNRISGLPVVGEEGDLVGMVTEGDFLRRGEIGTAPRRAKWIEYLASPSRLAADYVHTHGRRVAEVMSTNPITVAEDDSLDLVVGTMEQRHIKRLPVVRDGHVVGIVSRANLLRALTLQQPGADAAPVFTDSVIRDHIVAEIDREPWGPRYMVNVTVCDGTVDLRGSLFSEQQRRALQVVAENAPGVKAIRNHVVLIEPNSGLVIMDPDAARAEGSSR